MIEAAGGAGGVRLRDEAYENFAGKPPLDVLDAEVLRAYVDHGFADTPDGTVRLKCAPASTRPASTRWARSRPCSTASARCAARCWSSAAARALRAGDDRRRGVADAIPDGSLPVLDGLGHFGPLEDPALSPATSTSSCAILT